jgi:hypothetical protein
MKRTILALFLMLAFFAYGKAGVVSAKQSTVIELITTETALKFATIRLDDQNLLFESYNSPEAYLLTPEAFYVINHKDKTYRVQSFDELQAAIRRKLSEIAGAPENRAAAPDTDLKLTEDTETVSGLKTRKLIETGNGPSTNIIWVSSDLVPQGLRAASEKLRLLLPADYWKKVRGHPGIPEIILLYGIPLKLVSDGRPIYTANVIQATDVNVPLDVPAGYRKVAN